MVVIRAFRGAIPGLPGWATTDRAQRDPAHDSLRIRIGPEMNPLLGWHLNAGGFCVEIRRDLGVQDRIFDSQPIHVKVFYFPTKPVADEL